MMSYWTTDSEGEPFIDCGRDCMKYFRWHKQMPEEGDWYIAKTGVGFQILLSEPAAGVRVSTVYLGMDHSIDGGEPVLWETMVFADGWKGDFYERHTSLEEARERHIAVRRLIAAEGLGALEAI